MRCKRCNSPLGLGHSEGYCGKKCHPLAILQHDGITWAIIAIFVIAALALSIHKANAHHQLDHKVLIIGEPAHVRAIGCDLKEQASSIAKASQDGGMSFGTHVYLMYRRLPNEKNEPSCDVQDYSLVPIRTVDAFQLEEPYFVIECDWGGDTLFILSTYPLIEKRTGA